MVVVQLLQMGYQTNV
jgi:hypothetical protein